MATAQEFYTSQESVCSLDARDEDGNAATFENPPRWVMEDAECRLEPAANGMSAKFTSPPTISAVRSVTITATGDGKFGPEEGLLTVIFTAVLVPNDIVALTGSMGEPADVAAPAPA